MRRTGFNPLPPNFRTFDQISDGYTTAVSNKTLDLLRDGYSNEASKALFRRLKIYVDQVADFRVPPGSNRLARFTELKARRLHLLLPRNNALPAQELQIAAAEIYARNRGVILQVEYGY